MSFSSDVKKELAERAGTGRHCQLAELSAVIGYAGKVSTYGETLYLQIATENSMLKKKFGLLLRLLFDFKEPKEKLSGEAVLKVLQSVKLWDDAGGCFRNAETADGLLVQQGCCKRAFIRGAFLAAGSMSNPQKAYHFEIVCNARDKAQQVREQLRAFELDAKIVSRKNHEIVYLKEGSQIVDALNIMGAHTALMDLENVIARKPCYTGDLSLLPFPQKHYQGITPCRGVI